VYSATALQKFRVTFGAADTTLTYTVANVTASGKILVSWPSISANTGTSTGTVTYVDDFIEAGNTALDIDDEASVNWEISDMDKDAFTLTFDWQPSSIAFTGNIIEMTNSTDLTSYYVGYNGTRFYYAINEIYKYLIAEVLDITKVYIIELLPTTIRIKKQV
jgi:hypothetical protein